MHQRKAEMASNSDCCMASPGGYGTLEELFHDKPVGLLNVDGFYNSFLSFIHTDTAVDDGFKVTVFSRIGGMPHLSLLYRELADEEKKRAQEKVCVVDETISSLNFTIDRLALYKCNDE